MSTLEVIALGVGIGLIASPIIALSIHIGAHDGWDVMVKVLIGTIVVMAIVIFGVMLIAWALTPALVEL